MSPAFSRTRRCFETAGKDMSKGLANSVTVAPPWANLANMARRVGSERAEKVRLREGTLLLTIWLNISTFRERDQVEVQTEPDYPVRSLDGLERLVYYLGHQQ